jgi:TolB-like protein
MPDAAVNQSTFDRPSIAVLPFENMSGDSEQEYFADGITEDTITGVSKLRWFFVIARNSSFAYGRAHSAGGSLPRVLRSDRRQ